MLSIFKQPLRRLRNHAAYSLVAVLGLVIGLTAFILIGSCLLYYAGYDHTIKEYANTWRIDTEWMSGDTSYLFATSPFLLIENHREDYPDVTDVTLIKQDMIAIRTTCEGQAVDFYKTNFCSRNVFDFLNLKFIYGTADAALEDMHGLVLTQSESRRLFGDENPLGKEFWIEKTNFLRYVVSGVIEDLPSDSHIQMSSITLADHLWNDEPCDDYLQYQSGLYVTLNPGASIDNVLTQMNRKRDEYFSESFENITLRFSAIPVSDMHFHTGLRDDFAAMNPNTLLYLGLVAALVLIIAIINFVNLMLLKMSGSYRQVGINKTLGASRGNVALQYMVESLLIVAASVVVSVVLSAALRPSLEHLLQVDFSQAASMQHYIWFLAGGMLVIGMLVSAIPALRSSRFTPVQIMRRSAKHSSSGGRYLLVGMQVMLSIFMLYLAVIMHRQMQYVNEKDLGFDPTNMMVYSFYNYGPNMPSCAEIRDDLLTCPSILEVGTSARMPTQKSLDIEINIVDDDGSRSIKSDYRLHDFEDDVTVV